MLSSLVEGVNVAVLFKVRLKFASVLTTVTFKKLHSAHAGLMRVSYFHNK